MMVLIVSKPSRPKRLLAYAFRVAGLDTREVVSVGQANTLIRLFGSRNCVVVIEAESLSGAPGKEGWGAFLRSRPHLAVVVTACACVNDSIRDLVAEGDRILLEDPFDGGVVVAAVRRLIGSAPCEAQRTWCTV
jgi:hypothetical protein